MTPEQACLALISFGYNDQIDKIMSTLVEDDFSSTVHKEIFAAAHGIWSARKGLDLITLTSEVKLHTDYITSLGEGNYTPTNCRQYLDAILRDAKSRDMQRQCRLVYDALEKEQMTVEDATSQIMDTLRSFEQRESNERVTTLKEEIDTVYDRMDRPRDAGVNVRSGFDGIDRNLQISPGSLLVIAGRPSMGKSCFANNVCRNIARSGASVAIFTLETSGAAIAESILAAEGSIRHRIFRDATDKEKSLVGNVASRLVDLNFYISTETKLEQIMATAHKLHRQHPDLVIVVDYIQLVQTSYKSHSREQEIAYISRSLKLLAQELQIPVLALSQLNRGVEQREDKRPRMSDLRESGAIEQDADAVVLLYRSDYYDKIPPIESQPSLVEIIVAKNRTGPAFTAELTFFRHMLKFEELQTQDRKLLSSGEF